MAQKGLYLFFGRGAEDHPKKKVVRSLLGTYIHIFFQPPSIQLVGRWSKVNFKFFLVPEF